MLKSASMLNTHDLDPGVDPKGIGAEHAVGDVERGEGLPVFHETVGVEVSVEVIPHDLVLVVDPLCIGACSARDVEPAEERPVLSQTVVGVVSVGVMPTTWPRALIPTAVVFIAPATSNVVKDAPYFTKPWEA